MLGMDLPVMRLYPEHSLTERETDILMKKGMYLMVIRIIQPYGGVMNYTDDLAFLLKQGWQTMDDPVNPGQKLIYCDNQLKDYNIKSPAITQDYNLSVSGG